MTRLSLRIRVFLFFCLLGLGSVAIVLASAALGYRQFGTADALSAFATTAILASFGIAALGVFIWLLFDEHVSKPVEAMAAILRVKAHTDAPAAFDGKAAKHLGDLAPAVAAMAAAYDQSAAHNGQAAAPQIEQLTMQRDQLVQILSDLPVATILASSEHRIVLYDGQAAALMDSVGAARLKASVFDYLEGGPIRAALAQMGAGDVSMLAITVASRCGRAYSGHIRSFGPKAGYTLMLDPPEPASSRPLTYDFDLMAHVPGAELAQTALRDLAFVVFDTETTGLDPAKDEVVQLGAVRIVNGRLVAGETLDTLVNPGIPIPARSSAVHHITDAMVTDAPTLPEVSARFRHFADDAVLVAHNAGFDMAFLHRQAGTSGQTFDNPVLDTVLLSAVVFGGSAVHTLDALCERLGVVIPPEHRHTALGDALATAQALVASLDILEGRGIRTFGDLHRDMSRHQRILKS